MVEVEAPITSASAPLASGSSIRRRHLPSAKKPSAVKFQSNRMLLSQGSGGGPASPYSNASVRGLTGVRVTAEEADAILQELANKDDTSKKTWSRLFVERYLSKVGVWVDGSGAYMIQGSSEAHQKFVSIVFPFLLHCNTVV